MNRKYWISMVVAAICAAANLVANADSPFRNHMFDSFKGMPVNEKSIVFYGNSITNMHEWWECFGDDHRILNRGVSGALSGELLDNVESIIAGRPAKVFLMIGTNDLGTKKLDDPKLVASNIRRIIERFRSESPRTKLYVQSILPTVNGSRTLEKTVAANKLIQAACRETGTTYVDLYQPMIGIVLNELSYDKLHLTAAGYKIWGDIAAPLVGSECVYPTEFKPNDSGMKNSQGMRSTCWGVQAVRPDDVLFIGDEMVHGGEWHELFNSPSMKDRGTCWGYYGMSLPQWESVMEAIFDTQPERKEEPQAVVLNLGLRECNGKDSIPAIIDNYRKVVDKIRSYASQYKTRLIITSQIPTDDARHNAERVQPLNAALRELAAQLPYAVYADIYTPLVAPGNVANPELMNGNYVYAAGYNRIAKALAPYIGKGAKPISVKKMKAHYDYIQARQRLGREVEAAVSKLAAGEAPAVARELAKAQALLAATHPTVKQLNAATAALASQLK